MALADLVQGVTIDMNGQVHPRYVGTFRKVDAGMVNAAGKCFYSPTKVVCECMNERMTCKHISTAHCMLSTTRYLHVLQPEADAAVAGRRSSVPTVSSSSVAYAPPDRRGSEPALLQAEAMSRRECSRSQFVVNVSNPQHNTGRLAADIAEEQSQGIGFFFMGETVVVCISPCFILLLFFFFSFADTDTDLTASWESSQSSEVAQAYACDGRNEQVCLILSVTLPDDILLTQAK